MNKKTMFAGAAIALALVGLAIAGGPDFGRGLWFQHPAIFPPTQTIGSGGTITANACGGTKRITAASAVTTDTTNTIDAPATGNAGCTMDIINVGPNTITLDSNTNFPTQNTVDVVLASSGTVRVTSTGTFWKKEFWTQY
jgi:hypothetical protein